MPEQPLTFPPGLIVMTSRGDVRMESANAWSATRALFTKLGAGDNVAFQIVAGALVDKARNEAVMTLLGQRPLGWLMYVDADMLWEPDAPMQLLTTAYRDLTWADIVGAWCPLRGWPYLPTIDPGSGTWEPVEPGIGPIEVMRTGGAFVLVKRHVYERMLPPWYGIRNAMSPLDAMLEVENFALQKFDGTNPLRATREWGILERCAQEVAGNVNPVFPFNTVGEDSNFVDRARALGFRAVVNTNVIVQHVDTRIIGPKDHLDAMKELRASEAAVCGVLE